VRCVACRRRFIRILHGRRPRIGSRDGVLFPITAGERHNVSTRACVSCDGFVRVFLYLLGLRDGRLILLKLAEVEFYLRTKFGTT